MFLESGKIYKRIYYKNYIQLPSLQINEGVKVYVSNKGQKPSSINEMTELTGLSYIKINSIYSMTRWIAVTYQLENSEAYEMGLVTSPFKNDSEQFVITEEDVIVAPNIKLLLSPNFYLIWE